MFPGTIFPITIGRPRSQAAVQEVIRLEQPLGVLLQSKSDVDEQGPDDVHWVGTSTDVLRYLTGPDGSHQAVVRGLRRFRVTEFLTGHPFAVARVQYIDEPESGDAEIEGRGRALKQSAIETLQLSPQAPPEMSAALQGIDDPAQVADVIGSLMDSTAEEKQALLETFDLKARLDKLLDVLARRIQVLKVSRDVTQRTQESIGELNRKHLLREQMRTIQKELGESEASAEMDEFDKAITEAPMPAHFPIQHPTNTAARQLPKQNRRSSGSPASRSPTTAGDRWPKAKCWSCVMGEVLSSRGSEPARWPISR